MTLDIRIAFDHLPELARDLESVLGHVLVQAAYQAQSQIVQAMSASPSPSSPGMPPGIDTGALVNSIEVGALEGLSIEVTADAGHAIFLELGTVRMAPRPFMQPAAASIAAPLAEHAAAAIEEAAA